MPSSDASPTGPHGPEDSLFARIGGSQVLRVIVGIFYDRVLEDPELAAYFRDVDDRRLRSHQGWFLAAVLGGPDIYTGRDLVAPHAGLCITGAAFDLVIGHLLDAFTDLGTTDADRAEIAAVLLTYRATIVDGAVR